MRAVRLCGLTAVAAVCVMASAGGFAADRGAGFRPLATGVLTVVPAPAAPPGAAASATDTVSRADLLDVTVGHGKFAWIPLQSPPHTTFVERGRDREYPRDVWNLEFAFKPPRLIDVDVPVAGLKMQRKRIWYLVYRVRNAGGRRPVIDAADAAQRSTEPFETSIRFVPQLVLESQEPLDAGEGLESYRAYLDRVIPAALGPIRAREAGGRELLDSAAMVAGEIGPGEERWGVATWEDVDPRIDFFSIYVRGLTNAFVWRQRPGSTIPVVDPPEMVAGPDGKPKPPPVPGAAMEQALRTLRLDFWRPGDDRDEIEEEMAVGFAGMFERMTLGARLLEAASIENRDAAQPVDGLRAIDLMWTDLEMLEPKESAEPGRGYVGISLLPLRLLFEKLAGIADPVDRGSGVRLLLGDAGVAAIEDLAKSLAGPVDADQDTARRDELTRLKLGLTPETVAGKPLESLAKVIRKLEEEPSLAKRRAAAQRLFGPASRRIEALARQVALARTLGALEALDVVPGEVAAGDARAAFEMVRPAIEGLDDLGRSAIVNGSRNWKGDASREWPPSKNPQLDEMWIVGSPVPAGAPAGTASGDGVVWTGSMWRNVGPRGLRGKMLWFDKDTKTYEECDRRDAYNNKMTPEQQADFVADLVLRGLFGARGPQLFAAAAAVDEGIDHSWVFRYETVNPAP